MSQHTRIFISYARKDGRQLALQLKDDLHRAGHHVWLDTAQITGGANWSQDIERAIDRCDVALVLLSEGAYVSEVCRGEQLRALRLGKRVIPLLVQPNADRPVYLEHLNYRDFSDPARYRDALDALLSEIASGEVVALPEHFRVTPSNAPALPDHYITRVEALEELRQAVLSDETDRRVALTALQGMGGIGKTVLASALCRDQAILDAFPDGIVWVTVGRNPGDMTARLRLIGTRLGDDRAYYASEPEAVARLREFLANKSALIVLDDVWEAEHLAPFIVEAPRCRLLFTTRKAGLAMSENFTAELVELSTLTPQEALQLLRERVGHNAPAFPQIAKEMGYLPLALALVGARLRRGKSGDEWLRSYHDIAQIKLGRRPKNRHESLELCFDLSTEDLGEDAALYYTFGIFPEDVWVPQATVQRLWQHLEPDLNAEKCDELTDDLADLALIIKRKEDGAISLHDLLHDYTRGKLGDNYVPTQEALLSAYNADARPWPDVPDDGYLYDHLAYHLLGAERHDDLHALFADQRWLEKRVEQDKYAYSGYIADVMLAWEQVAHPQALAQIEAGGPVTALTDCVRLALIRTSVNSLAANYVPEMVARAVELGVWGIERALSIAERVPDPEARMKMYVAILGTRKLNEQQRQEAAQQALDAARNIRDEGYRVRALAALVPHLQGQQRQLALDHALTAVLNIRREEYRAFALAALAPHLQGPQLDDALRAAQNIRREHDRAFVLATLAPHLQGPQLDDALRVALNIRRESTRTEALAALAPRLQGPQRQQALDDALRAAQYIEDEDDHARALGALAPHLQGPQRQQALDDALCAAQNIRDEDARARALAKLAPHLQGPQRQQALDDALRAAQNIESEYTRARALAALAPHLQGPQLNDALTAAQNIEDEDARARALAALAPHLQGPQLDTALRAAQNIENERRRARVLAALAEQMEGVQRLSALRQMLRAVVQRLLGLQHEERSEVLEFLARRDWWPEELVPAETVARIAEHIAEIAAWRWP